MFLYLRDYTFSTIVFMATWQKSQSVEQQEELNLFEMPTNSKRVLLQALDHYVDKQGYVMDELGKRVICRYTHEEVHIEKAAILKGSTIIINANPFTLSQYMEEFLPSGRCLFHVP